ncbi:MAG: hypothetical protein NTZ74_15625 [Chloroflexi bacterium]|nr:hypothetical protein [Chloroflexota bacterium]
MDILYSPEKIVLSTFQHPDHPAGHNRFCQIIRDLWFRWCDLRLENEVPSINMPISPISSSE